TKRSMNGFPEARSHGLLTENVGDELVIFDSESSEAHALKPLAAAVFAGSDGNTAPSELAAIASKKLAQAVDVPQVEEALAELEDLGLLVDSEASGISRRHLLQVGGVAVAGALVTSTLVPAIAAASTTCDISGLSQFGILVT